MVTRGREALAKKLGRARGEPARPTVHMVRLWNGVWYHCQRNTWGHAFLAFAFRQAEYPDEITYPLCSLSL
jgi:hypothetical protein